MNDSPLRAFCESRHRKLIVAIVTTLVGLAVFTQLSDDYCDNRENRRILSDDLDRARQMERQLPKFTKAVALQEAKARELEELTVSDASMTAYRDRILEIVRQSGCQMRTLQAGQPTTRPWLKKDDPLVKQVKANKKNKTPFQLQRRNLSLLVDGEMANIHKLLALLEEQQSTAFPHRVTLSAASSRSGNATMEMNLWLFALTR